MSTTKVDEEQSGIANKFVSTKLWCPSLLVVGDGSKSRDDHGQGSCHFFCCLGLLIFLSHFHRHRVLSDWDADAKFGTEFHANGFYGFVDRSTLAGVGAGRHPIG